MPTYRPRRSATAVSSDAPINLRATDNDRTLPVTCACRRQQTPSWRVAIIDLPEPDEPTKPTRSPSAMPMHRHHRTIGLPYRWRCSDARMTALMPPPSARDWLMGRCASRNASPNRCNAITTIVTTSPGHSTVMRIDADEFHGRGRANAPNWARRRRRRRPDRSVPPPPAARCRRSWTAARSSTGSMFGTICLTNTRMPELASEPYCRFNVLPNVRRARAAGP